MELNKIYQGDTLEVLKTFPDECIDMVITSPPYYGLRNYGVNGQIGLEDSFEIYLKKILEITSEIKRVLKQSGTFWLNMGDCYASNGTEESRFYHGANQGKHKLSNDNFSGRARRKNYSEKCMFMQPERLAIKMIDDQDWILRNKIKWCKQVLIKKQNKTIGSVMPSSVKDRFNESGEELYFFVKNKKYYFDLDAVRMKPQVRFEENYNNFLQGKDDPNNWKKMAKFNYRVRDSKRKEGQPQFVATQEERDEYKGIKYSNLDFGQNPNELVRKKHTGNYSINGELLINILGKNLPTIWQIGSEPHNFQKELGVKIDHFAIFPQALLEIPIKAGSPENGIILDPFSGSGTTCLMAKKLKRNYIGIELSASYCEIAKKRIEKECPDMLL